MEVKQSGDFSYIDEGEGEILLLLHGLFGALSNWDRVVNKFSQNYRVVIPLLPIYTMPVKTAGLDSLNKFVEEFLDHMGMNKFHLIGNSLGGHVGLIYTLKNPSNVNSLILTGSSGLFENAMGGSFPRRGSYEYVSERVAYTFYDPKTATKNLIDEVFETTKSIPKALRIVAIAKSAQRHNMTEDVKEIKVPTLLIWGLNDTITPPRVAHEFDALIPNTTLRFIDHCGHAPMMERPDEFNLLVEEFLTKTIPG